ncbi:hypothetical protein ACTSKR_13290 [Chitinibacteraceae bacterium HSL-7]
MQVRTTLLALSIALGSSLAYAEDANQQDAKSAAERREDINTKAKKTLDELYAKHPAVKQQLAKATGYAYFQTGGFQAIFFGAGGGEGYATSGGKKVYMEMVQGKVGLGLGAKDTREVWIFTSKAAYNKFVEHGWAAEGEATAAAKMGDSGGQFTGAKQIAKDVYVYQFTENGLTAEATVTGSKYYKAKSLN